MILGPKELYTELLVRGQLVQDATTQQPNDTNIDIHVCRFSSLEKNMVKWLDSSLSTVCLNLAFHVRKPSSRITHSCISDWVFCPRKSHFTLYGVIINICNLINSKRYKNTNTILVAVPFNSDVCMPVCV